MIPQSKYNGCIEIWRYVLTFFVGLMHFYYCYLSSVKLFEGFYVAVDFFFMLSGFYLINTLNKSQLTAVAYTIRKYKTFFIIYSSSILYYVIESFTVGIKNGVNTFIKSTPDFLCLQMTGVFYPHTNGILWYISAMMVAGFFLASFFKLYPETTCKVLFPAFAILGYSYILLGNNNLDVTYLMNGKHIIPPGVIRAFSGMSIGGGYLPDIQYISYRN